MNEPLLRLIIDINAIKNNPTATAPIVTLYRIPRPVNREWAYGAAWKALT